MKLVITEKTSVAQSVAKVIALIDTSGDYPRLRYVFDLPVPEAKFETIVVQPSEFQQEMVAELSERAAAVHSGMVDPSEDNMLKITSDGRKIGLDQRLMNPLLPDDPDSKLNACVNNVLRIYNEGSEQKLTQLLFCDMSAPKNDGTFDAYLFQTLGSGCGGRKAQSPEGRSPEPAVPSGG